MSDALLNSLSLLWDIQKERGTALLPFYQIDLSHSGSFEDQINATHVTFTQAQKKSADFWSLLPTSFFDFYAKRTDPSFRDTLSGQSIVEWYFFNLEQPVYQLALGHLTNDPHFSPSQTSALIHLIASIMYLTKLRDIGVTIYIKAEINPHDSSRMKEAAASYLSREKLYLGLADDNLRQMIDEQMLLSASTLARMADTLKKIKSGYGKGVLASMSIHTWLEDFNNHIAILQTALTTSITKLTEQGESLAAQSAPGQSIDSDIELEIPQLASLPLFRGLSESVLRGLLRGAKLTEGDKNSVFLTQGEPYSRFYIVLDGWVKTTKESADGQEAIFQIVGKKEPILDINLFSSTVSPLTASGITKCRVLALSLPVLRDHISRNHRLAQNMLSATTTRLQKLVGHFEQITLKTAMQRVGWFFVNLHLETGLEGAPLKLPFDKALIAAYLNIKPETFSRVLRAFKEQGFIIEKDRVVLPDPHALCDYCDPEMAARCCRAEIANCAPLQLLKRAESKGR